MNRRDEIESALKAIRHSIPAEVHLIVVTKTFPVSDIEILYHLGERDFAENRVQDLVAKREVLDSRLGRDLRWHFQGKIQSNKIALLNRYADVIHSLDSLRHAQKIDESKSILMQINLDLFPDESERSGVEQDRAIQFAKSMTERFGENFLGVMGVAPHHDGVSEGEISEAFLRLKSLGDQIRRFAPDSTWVSAGMSDDFRIAIAAGATHIRLGSSILGRRTQEP